MGPQPGTEGAGTKPRVRSLPWYAGFAPTHCSLIVWPTQPGCPALPLTLEAWAVSPELPESLSDIKDIPCPRPHPCPTQPASNLCPSCPQAALLSLKMQPPLGWCAAGLTVMLNREETGHKKAWCSSGVLPGGDLGAEVSDMPVPLASRAVPLRVLLSKDAAGVGLQGPPARSGRGLQLLEQGSWEPGKEWDLVVRAGRAGSRDAWVLFLASGGEWLHCPPCCSCLWMNMCLSFPFSKQGTDLICKALHNPPVLSGGEGWGGFFHITGPIPICLPCGHFNPCPTQLEEEGSGFTPAGRRLPWWWEQPGSQGPQCRGREGADPTPD